MTHSLDWNFDTTKFMNGEQPQLTYFPPKDYPVQYTSVIAKTPQFLSRDSSVFSEGLAFRSGSDTTAIIGTIK